MRRPKPRPEKMASEGSKCAEDEECKDNSRSSKNIASQGVKRKSAAVEVCDLSVVP